MRARLMLKLIGILVMLVLTIIAAKSFSPSPKTSPLNPATLLHNGLSGLCANEQATAAAEGDQSPQTLQLPASQSSLAGAAQAAGLNPGTFTCPTTPAPAGS